MKHAGQVFTLGPAGFEPTTCRRGDRSTKRKGFSRFRCFKNRRAGGI